MWGSSPGMRRGRVSCPRILALYAGAYLYGSLPLVYLLGRRRRVDLKRVGSGNVGATNLMAAGGLTPATIGWMFDFSKGFLPITTARRLGCSEEVAGMAGALGMAGQCWPVFLRFQGGRGISSFVGATAALAPRTWPGTLLPMICGGLWRAAPGVWHGSGAYSGSERAARSKAVPLGCFISAASYPLLHAMGTRGPTTARIAPMLLSAIILTRRLTAAQPDDATVGPARNRAALLYRVLYDRNTSV